MSEDGSVPGVARRYVAFLRRRHRLLAVFATLLFFGSLAAASRLKLRADLSELLAANEPALIELHKLYERVGSRSTVIIAIEGPDPIANEKLADDLATRLQPLLGKELSAIEYKIDSARDFYEHNKALFVSVEDLQRIDEDFQSFILEKKNPAYIALDDPIEDLKALQAEREQKAKDAAKNTNSSKDRFPRGYYEGEDGRLLAMICWSVAAGTGDKSSEQITADVRRIVEEANAGSARFGTVHASITGDALIAQEEHDALKSDIELVSILCTVLVLLVIVVYFRSFLAIPHIFLPTLLGVAMSFGVTAYAIGYLNTNTAFLGSIILGNGMNFGVILLARWQEERSRGAGIDESLARAIATTARPTLAAALAAGIAYGSLGMTRFRGFQQFGFVGGIGMVLCWLATYGFTPTLILLWDGIAGGSRAPRSWGGGGLEWLSARVLKVPGLLVALALAATTMAGVRVAHAVKDPFDYNFSKLRSQATTKSGAAKLWSRVSAVFPAPIAPFGLAVVPALSDATTYRVALLEKDCADGETRQDSPVSRDSKKLAAECARRVAAGEPTGGILADVKTAQALLPGQQPEKLKIVAHIRKLLSDPHLKDLTVEQQQQLDDWTPPADLRALAPEDLPESLARWFREKDGTVGRVVQLYPVSSFSGWDGRALLRMADLIREVNLPDGRAVRASGTPSVFAAMLRSIKRDGPRSFGVAVLGVFLLVIVFFASRVRGAGLVLFALSAGVLWMMGVGARLGYKLNFLNFVALPVTVGIGVDYAVNIYARLVREPLEAFPRALAETGSAVALCSSTTIIGYSSLLIAKNGALRSFGELAVLGEVGCLLAALVLVPAVVTLTTRRATARANAGS